MGKKNRKGNRRDRARTAAAGWAALAVLVTVLLAQWQSARREARLGLAGELAAQGRLLAGGLLDETGLLLAVQSMNLEPSADAAQALALVETAQPAARTPSDGYISQYAFSPDGRLAASGSERHTIRIWDLASGATVLDLAIEEGQAASMAFSADGARLAAGFTTQDSSEAGIAYVWEVPEGTRVARIVHDYGVKSVDLSADGRTLVTGSYDGTARAWDLDSGLETAALVHPGAHTVFDLDLSADGRLLASGTREDYAVRVWQVETGRELMHAVHDGYVTSVSLSPDGRIVAAGSSGESASLRLWEVASGRQIARMPQVFVVTDTAFSPDGRQLISACEDLTVRVWDAASGRELARIGDVFARGAAFSADGGTARAGDYYGTVHSWKWRAADLVAGACARVSRNLTRDEWQTYIGGSLSYRAVCPGLPIEPEPRPVTVPVPTAYPTPVSPP